MSGRAARAPYSGFSFTRRARVLYKYMRRCKRESIVAAMISPVIVVACVISFPVPVANSQSSTIIRETQSITLRGNPHRIPQSHRATSMRNDLTQRCVICSSFGPPGIRESWNQSCESYRVRTKCAKTLSRIYIL